MADASSPAGDEYGRTAPPAPLTRSPASPQETWAEDEWVHSRRPAMSISNILNDHPSSSSEEPPAGPSTSWATEPRMSSPPLPDDPDAFPTAAQGSIASSSRAPSSSPTATRTLSRVPSSRSMQASTRAMEEESAWDSDLSADENVPLYAAELASYCQERQAHETRMASAYTTLLQDRQRSMVQRLCERYEKRFLAAQRRAQAKRSVPATDADAKAIASTYDDDDIDMELLDTLSDTKRSRRASSSDYLDELVADVSLPDDHGYGQGEPIPELIDPDTGALRGPIPIGARRAAMLSEAHDRVWTLIAKRDIPKVYRTVVASATNKAMYWRRLSMVVQREARRGAARNNKSTKDIQLRARKVMRELLLYWKRNEREERDLRKKAEKEALEKAKKEEEMREAKRQARKLNFLITQTELYSHFVGNKLKTAEAEESDETAGDAATKAAATTSSGSDSVASVDPDAALQDIDFDDEDESNLRAHAARNATEAVQAAREKAQAFDAAVAQERRKLAEQQGDAGEAPQPFSADDMDFLNPTSMGATEVTQPKMLTCTLKPYQLKGLSWLANLYEQGINGILADEMGLGKTVQSISLMAYLAEVHDIWGPFLVIAPASTLHNWQQEITKFVPALKALPYWGNVKDRAVLRKFWNRKQISYDRDAPFHVLVTSYQLVVSDEKYFQRVKWQYMVLDEAQAIKSSSSNRWKTLLGFHCRNRLLLTGTPVQNSMQELWALLHFIMPSLFDSHDEFSEWFSKDIENHAENKGTLNEHQLRRLHMILKPFMLRRVKKNVQNELGEKIEIDVFCELSARQKMLYQNLRSHVSVAELVDKAATNDESGLKSLMNLVMQFRKVCNHPELFERADVRAPLAMAEFASSAAPPRDTDLLSCSYTSKSLLDREIPRLLVQDAITHVPTESNRVGFDTQYLDHLFNIWRRPYIHEAVHTPSSRTFDFVPFFHLQPSDVEATFHGPTLTRLVRDVDEAHTWAQCAPYMQPDWAASALRRRGYVHQPLPWAHERPTPTLVPLGDIVSHVLEARGGMDLQAAIPAAVAPMPRLHANDRTFYDRTQRERTDIGLEQTLFGLPSMAAEDPAQVSRMQQRLPGIPPQGLVSRSPAWQLWATPMQVPRMDKLIVDSAKLARLDSLLRELKAGGHRVLIYFQMTRMIDLMEEYLIYRQYKYLRLDGASKISDRRDMVTDWQTRPELFIFLLSTRAGGLGINLTAADTVIFYDHDWNPSNDSQAMDRAHRLGQTKQVTVYRLITKGTIDERIVKMARNKKEVQDIVVGNKAYSESGMAKPQEIVSLLLDDDELADSMLRRKQADEAQQAQDKADNARAMHARRKQNKAAQRESTSVVAPGVNWALDDDEDDFFGAKPPPPDEPEESTKQPRKRVKRESDGKRRGKGAAADAATTTASA
ncbi:ino80-atpase with chromatin remodeling and helicase activity [Malassezia pachydermatis]|uniref:Chromatin-remodeling ATPase INO80 n=1 Tax=Malassezia pachydermatis TaxID=77020 RepID=A0A0M9VP13_9BASI|nr:ino80-atpase with chromatin remodeling and helicase activity [Malassezia pachydermatis]KOS13902.1 ino80-atpase with chromatin remodeling and helicase activity [Malassezia pachydermatis]